MTREKQDQRADQLKSLVKAMAILDCFSGGTRKLAAAEIAKRVGLPRGTTHRFLVTLRELGLLEQERERDQYRLGTKLFGLGMVVLTNMEIYHEAQEPIRALSAATGETVHLALLSGAMSIVISRAGSSKNGVNIVYVLEMSPAYCTSTGKAALAFQSEDVIDAVIGQGLRRYTETTITDPETLRAELREIRERGYAIDQEEHTVGTHCIGAPIRSASGRVFASISVSGHPRRLTKGREAVVAEMVMEYADDISRRLT
ncbi:IclR family transcriptional regulator [Sphingomonas oryzagri]